MLCDKQHWVEKESMPIEDKQAPRLDRFDVIVNAASWYNLSN